VKAVAMQIVITVGVLLIGRAFEEVGVMSQESFILVIILGNMVYEDFK
jgi:uncharacterized membrane protein